MRGIPIDLRTDIPARARGSLEGRGGLLSFLLFAVAIALAVANTASATVLFWDPALTNSSAGGGGGIWNLNTTANWFPTGGGADQNWTDSAGATDTASFGGVAGAVTVSGSLGALGLVFTTAGYTLSSGTLSLGSSGINTGTLTSGSDVINTAVNFVASQNWDVGAGSQLFLNGPLTSGTAVTITTSGATSASTITFSGTNAFSDTFNNTGNAKITFANKNSGSAAANWNFETSAVTIASANGTVSFGSLTAAGGSIAASGNSARLRVGDTGISTVYSGVIGLSGSTFLGLFKVGAGSLTLTGLNDYTGTGNSGVPGFPTIITAGAIIAGVSTNGNTSGPLGPSSSAVMLGNNTILSGTAGLFTGGAFTVSNPITFTAGTTAGSEIENIGGNTDNTSSFSGAITLQNSGTNLITQVVSAGSNVLNLISSIAGTVSGTGAAVANSPNNTGVQTITFAGPGVINDSGSIMNGGATAVNVVNIGGITTLSANDTYSGTTTVNGGSLLVIGSLKGTPTVNVNNTGVLGGNGGSIGSTTSATTLTVNGGGALAPHLTGTTTGSLTIGSLGVALNNVVFGGTSGSNSVFSVNINAATNVSDLLTVNGTLDLSGVFDQLTLNVLNGTLTASTYTLASFSGGYANTGAANVFDSVAGLPSGYGVVYTPTSVLLESVPEPRAQAMILSGAGLLALLRRRRSRHGED